MSESINVVDKFFGEMKNENERFSLNQQFLSEYSGKDPKFGFNGLGQVTYYRTYSRIKDDGTKERFYDTAVRVIEGTYEIQRRYCKWLHLAYDKQRAQDSAQEMFERMWHFKWIPPGRGLWIMGTPFMWRSGGASLNNCFKGDTEFITREGIKKLGDCVNTIQKVLTSNGKWVDAKIKSFGVQPLQKIVVRRGRWRKSIFATADHRWFVHSKSKKFATVGAAADSKNVCTRECTTSELESGVRLSMNFGSGINNTNLRPSAFGIAHGVCFGDGTTGSDNENHGTYLYLCKPKDVQLEKFFSACYKTEAPEKGEHGAIRVADLPRMFRKAPDLNESSTYLYGFLSGYFAADGDVTNKGTVRVASSEHSNLELVQSICAILGIGTYEISQGLQTVRHKGKIKKFIGYRLTLMAEHLNSEFFLIDEHKQRFNTRIETSRKKIPTYQSWYVESVEDTPLSEEVFCPQVPETYCFTLAGNILTGNCGFVSTNDDIESDPSQPFAFAMDMLMLGVGIGFDTKGANRVKVKKPHVKTSKYVIDDSREGWVKAFSDLIRSYTIKPELGKLEFDYSAIRPKGTPIKGFGGEASGPEGLTELLNVVDEFLGQRIKTKMSSVDIADLMNMVGKCVVAGNVRRCMPKGSLVHCIDGLKPIESLDIGQLVLTSTGYRPVTDLMIQGIQSVVRIKTNSSDIICTPNHRIAVLISFNEYEWKLAEDLKSGDRIVFVDEVLHGSITRLPKYSDIRKYNSTATKISVPQLDEQIAWMLGYLAGDGYVQTTKRKKRGGSRYIGFAFNDDEYSTEIEQKLRTALLRFGVNVCNHKSDDNSKKLRITSSRLVDYFLRNFKMAKTSIDVPQCILLGTPSIRASYLAGVLDSDGSVKTRPNLACTTIYSDFRNQIVSLYASLGIPTRYKECVPSEDHWNAKWAVNLVGEFALRKFEYLVQPHSIKKIKDRVHNSGYDFGYPNDMVIQSEIKTKRKWCRNSKQMTVLCARELGVDTHLIPITVESVEYNVDRIETYDITVDGQHEFVVNGVLVHNSAEIAFGQPTDIEYRSMKNPTRDLTPPEVSEFYKVSGELYAKEQMVATKADFVNAAIAPEKLDRAIEVWNAMNDRRWASNNSVFSEVGMDYTDVGHSTAVNGEPGYIWLDNMRDFGRMKDGRQPGIDGRVMGSNPCVSGDTMIQTKTGAFKIVDTIGQSVEVWNGSEWSKVEPRKTGSNRLLRRVVLSDGSFLDATSNHKWSIKKESGTLAQIDTDFLLPGDVLESFSLPIIKGTTSLSDLMGSLAAGNTTISDRIADVHKTATVQQLLDSREPLPNLVMEMGTDDSAQFLFNYAKTNGIVSIRESKLILMGPAHRLYQLQIIARRACQSNTIVDVDAKTLTINEISGKLCVLAGGKDAVAQSIVEQSVVSIDMLPGLHDTYCFNEPHHHKGVFNNVLTHQCVEQTLESYELCNLVETFPVKNEDENDYMRTIKYAYLYGKTVTLLPTHNDKTNGVMLRNRRIGLSQSGIVQGFEKFGRRRYIDNFCDAAYSEIKRWDRIYSEYLVCRESIKVTSVKPSGTVSLIVGVTPGIHFPEARSYWRRMRLAANSPLVEILRDAGYHIEPDMKDSTNTMVVTFGVEDIGVRPISDVTIWEQMDNVAAIQHYWADNAVSVTIQFKPEEAKDIPKILEHYEDRIKAVSFLPHFSHGYAQAPYEEAKKKDVVAYNAKLRPIDFSKMLDEAIGERFCDTDKCTLN